MPRSGPLPAGWVAVDFEIAAPARLFADDGFQVKESPTPLPAPVDGRSRGVVRLPDQVAALYLEGNRAGALRIRPLSRIEVASRLAGPVLASSLREPHRLERAARLVRDLLQARRRAWSVLKRRFRDDAFPPPQPGPSQPIAPVRLRKMARLRPFLRDDLPHVWRGDKADYLSDELRREADIADADNVSANPYDPHSLELIESFPSGLVLDCGAGKRERYLENVVNFEIADYDSTDVLGVGEVLPFKDASFDGVLSLAVLEHVRDPFRCAAEIVRVLKPGGQLICVVPFLQPLHGYPHHYYNMTHQGLRALFERGLRVERQLVIESVLPVWTLTWFVQSWAAGLPGRVREHFLDLPLRTFMRSAQELVDEPYVRSLSEEKNFELASATMLLATKPR
jgi:SAM-dependent methyltransferase